MRRSGGTRRKRKVASNQPRRLGKPASPKNAFLPPTVLRPPRSHRFSFPFPFPFPFPLPSPIARLHLTSIHAYPTSSTRANEKILLLSIRRSAAPVYRRSTHPIYSHDLRAFFLSSFRLCHLAFLFSFLLLAKRASLGIIKEHNRSSSRRSATRSFLTEA